MGSENFIAVARRLLHQVLAVVEGTKTKYFQQDTVKFYERNYVWGPLKMVCSNSWKSLLSCP